MSRKRCGHPADALDWFDVTLSFRQPADGECAVFLCCRACGLALPFGESNDKPESVRVEIRAAEIAAQGHAGKCNGGPFEWDCERCGWERWGVNHIELKGRSRAGYLARAIVEHDKEAT